MSLVTCLREKSRWGACPGYAGNASVGKRAPEQPERLGLRPAEVAKALGLSERTIREVLPEIPHLRIGTAIVIPIDALREWLNDQAKAGKGRVDAAVDDILSELE